MSKANAFIDVLSSQPSFHVAQSLDTPQTSSTPSVSSNGYTTVLTSALQTSVSQPPTYPAVNGSGARVILVSSGRKGKQRLVVDQRIINKASERFYFLTFARSNDWRLTLLLLCGYDRVASLLAADHLSVMFPDVNTSFADIEDVIRRLLPYHVLQQPAKDLQEVIYDPSGKGKARAVSKNEVDIEGTKLTIEYYRRIHSLRQRFQQVKVRSSQRSCPEDQAYVLAHTVLDTERDETTALNVQLRVARAELEKYNREHRPQTVQPIVRPTPPLTSTTYSYTPQYRHCTYPYAQYQSNYTQVYPGFSTAAPSTTQFQYSVITTPVTVSAAGTTASSPSQTMTAQTQTSPTTLDVLSKPVSISLPISSLPALQALGIMPVSSLSVPPPGQPQPQAILKGTTANGTMLSLDVNIGLLQATQVSGLALIINAIAAQAVSATSSQSGTSSTRT
ncbi:hypothetical protein BDM02DRAFT_3191772 [Thelephora ganbajun]|uniref:Uncharacterized protein n=1 Tax=Thelephora ganbajun TaxID=370292 RepID=A0ACB6Z0X1_THEGA|nr:hypothetical protein BDM02DRAFT_3191772 [Thelephora ganbajun]